MIRAALVALFVALSLCTITVNYPCSTECHFDIMLVDQNAPLQVRPIAVDMITQDGVQKFAYTGNSGGSRVIPILGDTENSYYVQELATGTRCQKMSSAAAASQIGAFIYTIGMTATSANFEHTGTSQFMHTPAYTMGWLTSTSFRTLYIDQDTRVPLGMSALSTGLAHTYIFSNVGHTASASAFSVPAECSALANEAPTAPTGGRALASDVSAVLSHPLVTEYEVPDDFDMDKAWPRGFAVDYTKGRTSYTPLVSNQDTCGSCWAWGIMQGVFSQVRKYRPDLDNDKMPSPQWLMDCDTSGHSASCDGGYPLSVAKDLIGSKARIPTIGAYPYVISTQQCKEDDVPHAHSYAPGLIRGVQVIPSGSEAALLHALLFRGPVSISICSAEEGFYESRLDDRVASNRDKCTMDTLDHAVLLVGAGIDEGSGEPYWLIQNSWGNVWREDGLVRVALGRSDQYGVALEAFVPVIDPSKIPF